MENWMTMTQPGGPLYEVGPWKPQQQPQPMQPLPTNWQQQQRALAGPTNWQQQQRALAGPTNWQQQQQQGMLQPQDDPQGWGSIISPKWNGMPQQQPMQQPPMQQPMQQPPMGALGAGQPQFGGRFGQLAGMGRIW